MKIKYFVAFFVVFVIPILIGFGLYSIRNEHHAVTNVCNEFFYPELCGNDE